MKNYSYYLFDADGTLIDTVDLIIRCFEHTCMKFGNIVVAPDAIRENVGLPLRSQMELYLGTLSDERFDIIAREHMELQLKLYPTYLRAFPGVAEGLARLKHGGKHCAVVTSRRQDTLDLYLKETGLYDYFEIFVTPDSTLRHKPDAEPALKALSMFNASPDQAVFIGDSTFDIECAAAAGVDSVFVNWSSNDPSALAVLPTYRIDSMTELYQE